MPLSRHKANLQSDLLIFNYWLENEGKPLTNREIRALNVSAKNTLQDVIAKKVDCIEENLKVFLKRIMQNKDKTRLQALEFNNKATTMLKRIDMFLLNEQNVTLAAQEKLKQLNEKLISNMAWVRNTYNIPVLIRSGNAHKKNEIEHDFETLRKNGNFDIKHQQRKHRMVKAEKITVQK